MKGVISLIVLAIMLLVGCNDDSSILEPTNGMTDQNAHNKIECTVDEDSDSLRCSRPGWTRKKTGDNK